MERLRLTLTLPNHSCTIEHDDRWINVQGIVNPGRGPEGVTTKDDEQTQKQYQCTKRVFGRSVDWIPKTFPHFFITILRFCAFRYRSVTLKCGVGGLVGGLTDGERCAHGATSSSGELSPKTSGTRSEHGDEPSPYPLEGCERIVRVTSWLAHPMRNGRDVLVTRLGTSERKAE